MTQAETMARPTARDEAWRYSDHAALAALWPVDPREPLIVATGETGAHAIVVEGDGGVHHHQVTVADGGTLAIDIVNVARRFGRVALDVTLGADARFDLRAVQLGTDDATLELVTVVAHQAPDAVSRQIVRSVLGGRATGTYLGKVAVARGAQGTDSTQSARAMLLSRDATANTKPELEIFADDVKCAHGAAVGELDADALFYLQSRGIAPADARRLMLRAFIAEALGDDAAVVARADAALAAIA